MTSHGWPHIVSFRTLILGPCFGWLSRSPHFDASWIDSLLVVFTSPAICKTIAKLSTRVCDAVDSLTIPGTSVRDAPKFQFRLNTNGK